MAGIFHLLLFVIATIMGGDHLRAIDDPYLSGSGRDGECLSDMGVRNAVVITFKAGVGGLANGDLQPFFGWIWVVRQGKQQRLLLCKGLAHGDGSVLWAGTVHRPVITPGFGLPVQVIQICPFTCRPEVIPHITYGTLYPSLLITTGYRNWTRLKAVVGGELQQGGMEPDRLTLTLQYCAFEVVIEKHPGQSAPSGEGRLMATQKIAHLCIEVKTQEDPT